MTRSEALEFALASLKRSGLPLEQRLDAECYLGERAGYWRNRERLERERAEKG